MIRDKIPASWLSYWQALPSQERLLLTLLAILLGALLIVFAAMVPAQRYADRASEYHRSQVELLTWVEANAAQVTSLPMVGEGYQNKISEDSLLTLASNGAKKYQITFKRFEPNGDKELRIWLEKISFNQLLLWLGDLKQKQGVRVVQANLDRRDVPGTVNARVVLSL